MHNFECITYYPYYNAMNGPCGDDRVYEIPLGSSKDSVVKVGL